MRRLRRTPALRALARETALLPGDLILPLFVDPQIRASEGIPSMPGVERHPVAAAGDLARRTREAGIGGVILFGTAARKGPAAPEAYDPEAAVPRALRAMREAAPDLVLMADVCLCAYTDHGHCGVVKAGAIDNDASLDLLAKTALVYARAGADVVAPSDMMDGRVAAIRKALDAGGAADTAILSYAAKYSSAFYGPFRDAQSSAPQFGDRRTYQMDPANAREAMREIALDLEEGADLVMVKPALAYLDILRAARDRFDAPLAAYNVSGEYSAVKAAAAAGWLDEKAAVLEILLSMRRAGADCILTYHALDAAGWLS
jgi:porphobilinogen synthase